MDFSLNEDQTMLESSLRRFLDETHGFEQRRKLLAEGSGASIARWKSYADLGWLGLPLPEAAGGSDGTVIETMLLHRELGRALVVDPIVGCSLLPGVLMQGAGGDLFQQLLPALADGRDIFAVAHEDTFGARTTAHRLPSGAYRINGAKSFVLGGDFANRFIVAAHEVANDATERRRLFMVDASAAGLERHCYRTVDDQGLADLRFDNVEVQPDCVADARENEEMALHTAIERATLADCCDALGVMERCVWTTRDYLGLRKQFGVPLSTFQALRHKMSDMLIELEQARSSIFAALAAWDGDAGTRTAMVSAAKVHVARSGELIGGHAVQLHGAIGVTEEYIASHCFRRLLAGSMRFGGVAFHLRRFQSFSQPRHQP